MSGARGTLALWAGACCALLTACEPSEQPPGRRLSESAPLVPTGFMLPTPKEAATATAVAPAADAATWATLSDLTYLLGRAWSSERVRLTFTHHQADSKTRYNLRFVFPGEVGGCGFYEELHSEGWRTAFCKGTNLGNTTHRTRLFVSRGAAPDRLKIVIEHFVDEELRAEVRR